MLHPQWYNRTHLNNGVLVHMLALANIFLLKHLHAAVMCVRAPTLLPG